MMRRSWLSLRFAAGTLPAAWAAHTNLTAIFLSRNQLAGVHSVIPLHCME